jgi:hypothetical protein
MNEKQFLSLPVEQRKALQQKLIDENVYAGNPDGKWGAGTRAAFEQMAKREAEGAKAAKEAEERARQDKLRGEEIEVEKLRAQSGKTAADADAKKKEEEAKAAAVETARKQRYADDASSGLGMATQSASNLVAPAAGTALGMALGKGVNTAMDASQESKNRVLREAAQDRLAGVTTRDGAREGAKLAGAMPINNTVARTTARMAPHLGLGAISMGKGAQVLSESDPNSEFYPAMADRAAGLGYIGVGAGLGKQGLRYAFSPGVAPDAKSIAIINSNQLRRNGAQGQLAQALTAGSPSPAPTPPQPTPAAPAALPAPGQRHRDALGRFAKVPKGAGIPGLAAALAYSMTPDEAQAADGRTVGGTGEALTNAGIAGGAAYGTSKLAEALGKTGGAALGMMSEASAPGLIDAMTDPTQDEMNTAANWQIRNLPQAMLSPAVRQTAEMGQVPPRGDRSDEAMLARAQDEQQQRMPMAAASSLQIPEGIPAPQADGSSPYGENIANRINRMVKLGAPPEAIANLLNQAVR